MSKKLLNWYDSVKRDLPWRIDKDPYKIWISEIMLQQTQVVTVVDYFNRFTQKYPDVSALAAAQHSDVLKLWEGLGYYSRAKNLMRCASIIHNDYGGEFPQTPSELLLLPGIGPYTAGAIASIAFNQMVPAIDGNVLRVISRLHCIGLSTHKVANLAVFKEHILEMMTERPGDFNQALMELGARVCTPRNAQCTICPVSQACCGYKSGTIYKYPNKPQKPPRREVALAVLILIRGDQVVITKKSNDGLLANLWGFPIFELDETTAQEKQIAQWIKENYDVTGELLYKTDGKQHLFTHIKWKPILFFLRINDKISIEFPILEWTTLEGLNKKAVSTAFTKQIDKINEILELINNPV